MTTETLETDKNETDNITPVERDFHHAPRPVRVRFAPTVPDGGGAFLHCGHLAMLVMAEVVSQTVACPLDFRFDGEPDAAAALDCANAVAWLQIPIRRFYVLPPAGQSHVNAFAAGEKHLADSLSPWHIATGYDDLFVENRTIIVRGQEFQYRPIREKITRTERLWGTKPYKEFLFPLLMRNGQKMSKSLNNTIHWSVLQEFPVARVKSYFYDMMKRGVHYELDWKRLSSD